MTWELICDSCGKVIPMGLNFIENGYLVFCGGKCESGYFELIEYLESAGYPGDD